MVKLFCAIVGVVGSAFEVDIDEGQKVGDLKKAIKDQSDGLITDPWPKLQLFLAKTEHGAWLDGAGAAAVTLDGDGHPQGFELMDPTLWVKNAKHFGANFLPGEGQVHVLVVVPKLENDRSPAMALGVAPSLPPTTIHQESRGEPEDDE
ncbi:hypothetical protein PC122_g25290 [Phytophthora cactorum]|nr:hypothetical protein PC122_g25290 [Phytophthora cactorum]